LRDEAAWRERCPNCAVSREGADSAARRRPASPDACPRYLKDAQSPDIERQAKSMKRGFRRDKNPKPPWEARKRQHQMWRQQKQRLVRFNLQK
jgi:hypothetical protein